MTYEQTNEFMRYKNVSKKLHVVLSHSIDKNDKLLHMVVEHELDIFGIP